MIVLGSNFPREPAVFDLLPPPSLTEQSRSPVVSGLQAAIKSLRREGNQLHLGYTLRWVRGIKVPRQFLFLQPGGVIKVRFWDAKGNKMDVVSETTFMLSEEFENGFENGKPDVFDGTGPVDLPKGAKHVAFELGLSGIVTKRVAIPE